MKLNKYFLMGAMGLGLFACSDDLNDNGQGGNAGDGTMANVVMKFDFNGSSSRAIAGELLPDGAYDDAGSPTECKVNKLRVIVTDMSNVIEYNQLYTGAEGDYKLPEGINKTTSLYEGEGTVKFQIPTGEKKFYVYINEEASTDLPTAVGGYLTNNAKEKNASFFTDATTGFHMSGMTEQEIVTVADGSTNEVTVEVDRVVAKVTLQLAEAYDNNADVNKVKLTSLTAGIGNADLEFKSESESNTLWGTYRFANNVSGDGETYRTTPYYEEVPIGDNYNNVIIRSNAADQNDDLLTPVDGAYPTHTYYCLENTHDIYKKGNTTFVQIIATMIPVSTVKFTYTAAGEGTEEEVGFETVTKLEDSDTPATFYVINKVKDPAGIEKDYVNTYIWEKDLLSLYGETGFVDESDKTGLDENADADKIKAVRNALKRRGYEFTEAYTGGVGYFYKAVNDLQDAGKYINKAPVFRNDWYDLTIKSIKLPGSPAPEFGGGEDLHPDTDVDMIVRVKKWNRVIHNVDLE